MGRRELSGHQYLSPDDVSPSTKSFIPGIEENAFNETLLGV